MGCEIEEEPVDTIEEVLAKVGLPTDPTKLVGRLCTFSADKTSSDPETIYFGTIISLFIEDRRIVYLDLSGSVAKTVFATIGESGWRLRVEGGGSDEPVRFIVF